MDVKKFELFRDWIPARFFWHSDQAFVDWCFFGKTRLTEPFFDDSVMKRFRQPFNLLFRHQTPIEFLGELNEFSEGLRPTGFIFHLSRCGSTLVSQMLAALGQNIVISEASPLDFVLRAPKISDEKKIEWLRWTINAFGQRRNPDEENFFIKFDSWNTLQLNLVKRAFPGVPWIFLYRNPVEIIVSHIRQPGAQTIPGIITDILPELSFEETALMPREEYCARVLGKICQSALPSIKNGEGLAVNFSESPAFLNEKILKHFKVELPEVDLKKMLAATAFNAKNPKLNYFDDTERKKKEATAAAIQAAEKFVNPFYKELELIRLKAQTSRL